MAPMRVFAKYLKNGLADLHQTLWLLRQLYRSSLKYKAWEYVSHCCHGNQLMGEYLAKNMIKEANFPIFFYSSQMMLKSGRNIRWVEIL